MAGIFAAILAINGVGWAMCVLALGQRSFHYGGLGVGLGAAFTAWTLGCRHAFDADHIAAIDNSTRKLMSEGRRPLATGFCFAIGHSTLVLVVGGAIAIAARPVLHAVVRPTSGFEMAGGTLGTVMSAAFLWLIAGLNLVVLSGILRVFLGLRRGQFDEAELEAQLQARGLMYRFFGRWMQMITRSWHLVLVGFAFGIGFDTATEAMLLGGTAAAATQDLPWYFVLALPVLFAGGMTLFDTTDGLLMNGAYGWAFASPVRKVYYNLTTTGLSIMVAFVIGGIEFLGLLVSELHLHGWFGDAVSNLNMNTLGFIVVGLFAGLWVLALAIWKFADLEERWERRLVPAASDRVLP